jgi:hypothetical protein
MHACIYTVIIVWQAYISSKGWVHICYACIHTFIIVWQVYITSRGCMLDGTSVDTALMAKRRRGGGLGEYDAALDQQVLFLHSHIQHTHSRVLYVDLQLLIKYAHTTSKHGYAYIHIHACHAMMLPWNNMYCSRTHGMYVKIHTHTHQVLFKTIHILMLTHTCICKHTYTHTYVYIHTTTSSSRHNTMYTSCFLSLI